MLIGANIHPWKDWDASLTYVASTVPHGLGIVRWDEQVGETPVGDVVSRYRQVRALGLRSMIVLVPKPYTIPVAENLIADYLAELAPALQSAAQIDGPMPIIEVANEPNWHQWPADSYRRALMQAYNASGDMPICFGGLAMNDRIYRTAVGDVTKCISFESLHLYTQGDQSPDDPDEPHQGYASFAQGVLPLPSGRPLIVGEFGWESPYPVTDYQRASYMRACVDLAQRAGVYALIAEEIGSGDTDPNSGNTANLINTASWRAFIDAGSVNGLGLSPAGARVQGAT